jgi:hypothetical protein
MYLGYLISTCMFAFLNIGTAKASTVYDVLGTFDNLSGHSNGTITGTLGIYSWGLDPNISVSGIGIFTQEIGTFTGPAYETIEFAAANGGPVLGLTILNKPGLAPFTQFYQSITQADIGSSYVICGAGNGYLCADNFTGTLTAETPLPTTLSLFASGLVVMGFLAKRKKRNSGAAIAA